MERLASGLRPAKVTPAVTQYLAQAYRGSFPGDTRGCLHAFTQIGLRPISLKVLQPNWAAAAAHRCVDACCPELAGWFSEGVTYNYICDTHCSIVPHSAATSRGFHRISASWGQDIEWSNVKVSSSEQAANQASTMAMKALRDRPAAGSARVPALSKL